MSDNIRILVEQRSEYIEDKLDSRYKRVDEYESDVRDRRIAMLDFVLEQSRETSTEVKNAEKSKTMWRCAIMWILIVLLCITVSSIGVLVWLYLFREIEFPTMFIVGLFGAVITQIISLLALFIKFITNVETLKLHATTTHKLLDYLSKYNSDDDNK